MKTKQIVAIVLAASILAAAFPGTARADEGNPSPQAPTVDFRAAIARAAAKLGPCSTEMAARQPSKANATQAAYGGGGGGGKGMLIVTLVSTVVGLGATYYLMKEMKKQTEQAEQLGK